MMIIETKRARNIDKKSKQTNNHVYKCSAQHDTETKSFKNADNSIGIFLLSILIIFCSEIRQNPSNFHMCTLKSTKLSQIERTN